MSDNRLLAHEIVSEASPRVPEVRTSNERSTAVTHEMHRKVDSLIGPQMIAEPGYYAARAEAVQREDTTRHNAREDAVPAPETALVSMPAERTSSHYHLDAKQEAGTALRVGAVAGTAYAAASALSIAVLAGVPSLTTVAAGTALVGAGLSGGLAAAGLYTGGLLHNVFWNRGGDGARPGVMGTLVRGIVSPITVPAGLLYSWAKK